MASLTKYTDPHKLAEVLIGFRLKQDRNRLLNHNKDIADVRLARAIRDICYSLWTKQPAVAVTAVSLLEEIKRIVANDELDAILSWVNGIALITKGSLEEAVLSLDNSSRSFRNLGKVNESAQPLVAKLMALAMLGRYADATKVGRRALRIFESTGDELAAAKVELNLSNIAARRERHNESEKLGLSSLERFRKIGETSWETLAENSLANTYTELNELGKAEAHYRSSLANAQKTSMLVTEAEIEASLGNLARFTGSLGDALRLLEASRSKYEQLRMPHQNAIAALEVAEVYAELNLVEEAGALFRKVLPVLKRLHLNAEEARARYSYAKLLLVHNHNRQSISQLERAAELFKGERNFSGLCTVTILIASASASAGNFEKAGSNLRIAKKLLNHIQSPRKNLAARLQIAMISSTAKTNASLSSTLKQICDEAARLGDSAVEIVALTEMGKLALASGNRRTARSDFEKAAFITESLRDPLPGEDFRRSFFSNRLQPFTFLTKIAINEGRINDAFESAERSRARSSESERPKTSRNAKNLVEHDPELEKLRGELNWIYNKIDTVQNESTSKLYENALRLERKVAERQRRSRVLSTVSRRSQEREQQHHILTQLQCSIGPKRAFIEYVESDGYFGAFVVTDSCVNYFPSLISREETRSILDSLHFQFGALRFGSNNIAQFEQFLKNRTDALLGTLHNKLISPILGAVGDRDLLVSPAGELNYVPFGALFCDGSYLIEGRNVVSTPSARIWLESRKGKAKAQSAILFGFADENIPLVDEEVNGISDVLDSAVSFLGTQATYESFMKNAPKADLLHLACHGRFRSDNPTFSSLHLADGWVTVNDIRNARLRAQLVTLSACETGVNELYPGEELLGFARGFLSSGARNIMLSLWNVNDTATRELMVSFYSLLGKTNDIAGSLREAQVAFIERNAHPYYWAPFFLIGQ